MILRFLQMFPHFRDAARRADYETQRAREAELRCKQIQDDINGVIARLTTERDQALGRIDALVMDRDFWRHDSRSWQNKCETLQDKYVKDLQEQVDCLAIRLTGRTMHGVAPPVPEQPAAALPPMDNGGRQHPRHAIREADRKTANAMRTFLAREQEQFQNGASAPVDAG